MPLKSQKLTNFGRAISASIEEHKLSQAEFSRRAGVVPEKTSRIIKGRQVCDVAAVDKIISAFPDRHTQFILIDAYLRDVTTPASRRLFSVVDKRGKTGPSPDLSGLSPRGYSALSFILDRIAGGQDLEDLFINFAKALGWK